MIKDEHWKEAHDSVTVVRRTRVLPVEPDSGIRLPSGWTKGWSKKEERQYYFNTNTGESRWDPPN
jgi:beta-lactamase class D